MARATRAILSALLVLALAVTACTGCQKKCNNSDSDPAAGSRC
jgi:hypothetical protein